MSRRREKLPAYMLADYQLIIRALWQRGEEQQEALHEMRRRGLWLTEEQKQQAGLARDFRAP